MKNRFNIKVMDGYRTIYYPNTIDHFYMKKHTHYSRRNNDCNVIGILIIKKLK